MKSPRNILFNLQLPGWNFVGLATAVLLLVACSAPAAYRGLDLGGTPAPSFNLIDQNGNKVSLAGLRGKVVALSFLYTHCLDVCPLTAEKFRQAADSLGPAATGVSFVGISVDPDGDTPDRVLLFLAAHQMSDRMLYLTGPRADLESIWQSYYLFIATPVPTPGALLDSTVGHSDRIVLLDRAGNERVNLDSTVTVNDLVYDLNLLLR